MIKEEELSSLIELMSEEGFPSYSSQRKKEKRRHNERGEESHLPSTSSPLQDQVKKSSKRETGKVLCSTVGRKNISHGNGEREREREKDRMKEAQETSRRLFFSLP